MVDLEEAPPRRRAKLAPKSGDKLRDSRATPPEVYAALDAEFSFTFDPCPLDTTSTAGAPLWGKDGLQHSWAGQRVFCNPPYSDIPPWLAKGSEAIVAVFLLPVRADLPWWHDQAMHADEIRFVRGRLRFIGMASGGAPFASAVVVFHHHRDRSCWVPAYSSWNRPARLEVTAAVQRAASALASASVPKETQS